MKATYLNSIIAIGMIFISSFSYAQKINIEEENSLKFQTHFFEALKQKAIKNYGKAIESLELCNEIDPLNVSVLFEFSKNHLELNNYFEANLFIDKALSLDPENIHLLHHKVAVLKAQRNFKNAIEIQKQIVQKQPKDSEELVFLYVQNQNFDQAEDLISEMEENAMSTLKLRGFKSFLENRKSVQQNIEKQADKDNEIIDIESLKKLYTDNKEFKLVRKILDIEASRELFELTYADSKEALELFPEQPYLYKMNGLALNRLGKYTEAIAILTIGIDFVIDSTAMEADFYEQLSISYEKLDNKSEAAKYKQRATELRKEN
jgi:tetratricopeptide (TPR) repeat protein